ILAKSSNATNGFTDMNLGLCFQYPSDSQLAPKQIYKQIINESETINQVHLNPTASIALVFPKSLDGSSFIILSESLPFPVSLEKYFDSTKKQLLIQG